MMVTPSAASGYRAVVFDLFGTLVDAPTAGDRRTAAAEIAAVVDRPGDEIEAVLVDSWSERHDGRIPGLPALAAFLARRVAHPTAAKSITDTLRRQALRRLRTDHRVLDALRWLRARELRLGLLSDASADIAEAWTSCALAPLFDAAVFSCRAGSLKPHPRLYRGVTVALHVRAGEVLYCGDGGGDELHGATVVGMDAVRIRRRCGKDGLVFGEQPWRGPCIAQVDDLPSFMATRGFRP